MASLDNKHNQYVGHIKIDLTYLFQTDKLDVKIVIWTLEKENFHINMMKSFSSFCEEFN